MWTYADPTTVIVITAILQFLDIVAVVFRFTARKLQSQTLKADDWLCLTALVGVAQLSRASKETTSPPGTPVILPYEFYMSAITQQYLFVIISTPTLGLIKLSVLFFYRRVLVTDQTNVRNLHNLLYIVLLSMTALWTMGYCLAISISAYEKLNVNWELYLSFCISDFLADAIVILLPIPVVSIPSHTTNPIIKLHLPTRKKLGILMIFLMGAIAGISSLVRLLWIIQAHGWRSRGPQFEEYPLLILADIRITAMLFWSMLEMNVGIIAICLPTMLPVFRPVKTFIASFRSRISVGSQPRSGLRSGYIQQRDMPQDVYPLVEIATSRRPEAAPT
ncbi:hypothetical protein P280DRAFT_534286 [Massarina eburnea CBS 473.64]|uniref:Rhodopsin domain-containing protein n=1 Tax=Massarina eburnea CBS 473.64 TaxID=1395130 RepID=A0A6A6RN67_9PLEO|nr:hypothetical protein P280DRAFT_534286 [Massarina eburnea CBS 473.64]